MGKAFVMVYLRDGHVIREDFEDETRPDVLSGKATYPAMLSAEDFVTQVVRRGIYDKRTRTGYPVHEILKARAFEGRS